MGFREEDLHINLLSIPRIDSKGRFAEPKGHPFWDPAPVSSGSRKDSRSISRHDRLSFSRSSQHISFARAIDYALPGTQSNIFSSHNKQRSHHKNHERFRWAENRAMQWIKNPWIYPSSTYLRGKWMNHGYPSNSWMFMDFSDKHSSISVHSSKTH